MMTFGKKRVMVDMSATLIHHGHIRLLQSAADHGKVIVALTSDEEIEAHKGYLPELSFHQRSEILQAISYVSEIVQSPWLLDDNFLKLHRIDFLLHGDDNVNLVMPNRLIIRERTPDISSNELRIRAAANLLKIDTLNLQQGRSSDDENKKTH
jgi:glycerol-3-phosphate cytidylyltransferase